MGNMEKAQVYRAELEKLTEIFKDVEPAKAQMAEGLIQDAAFLAAENWALRSIIDATGMVKIHPDNPSLQKTTEAAKQYLKNVNSYAVVIKALTGILQKNTIEGDDEFDEFIKEMRGEA